MRANLTAPAVATWLAIGALTYAIWHVPWYVGALSGFFAAAITYWAIARWNEIPEWGHRGIWAVMYGALVVLALPLNSEPIGVLRWVYTVVAAKYLYDLVSGYLRRDRMDAPQT